MLPPAALAAIHSAFARSVIWQRAGEAAVPCAAIDFIPEADIDAPFSGGGSISARGYEVPKAALPFAPRNGDQIIDGDNVWKVIQVKRYDIADAWRVHVERFA
jgi:hypothetical protein